MFKIALPFLRSPECVNQYCLEGFRLWSTIGLGSIIIEAIERSYADLASWLATMRDVHGSELQSSKKLYYK